MRFASSRRLPLLVSALLWLGGCAAPLESRIQPDWQSDVQAHPLADTAASADGGRIVVGNPRNVVVVDGANGEPIGVLGGHGILQVTVNVAGEPFYKLRPESSNIITLQEAGLLLVLDYSGKRERITALDLDTGEKRWSSQAFSYSLQQYETAIRTLAAGAGNALADALGGESSTESLAERRTRQRDFAKGLARSVDEGRAVLFKTFDGLIKIDAATGTVAWRVSAFNGPGILELKTLDDGDYLVLAAGQDLTRMQAAEHYDLARIAPDGTVRWISEHAGRQTAGMQVAGDHVVVDGSPLQVFDLSDGEQRWENRIQRRAPGHPGPRTVIQPPPLIVADTLYQAAPTHGEDGSFATVGFPHRVRSYELATGDLHWETERSDTSFGRMIRKGDHLLVRGVGELFGGGGGVAALDTASGALRWRSPDMATPGTFTRSVWVTEPVFDARGERVFVAGPEDLYGMRVDDGRQSLHVDLSETEIGGVIGLVRHADSLVVIGRQGVAGFDTDDGDSTFALATDYVTSYERRGDRLVLAVTASALDVLAEGGGRSAGVVLVDLARGTKGELAAWDRERALIFGALGDGRAFVTDDGRHAFAIGSEGRLTRFSLE